MKFYFYSVFVLFFSFTSSAQRVNEKLDIANNSREFSNYIDFVVKIVDFENSLNVNDFKTTEFQIENGFTYPISKTIDFSFGINGGVILGIPYQDRMQAYFNSGNISGIDTFLKYYREIDFVDQSLAKTRYFIGLHPQLGFNIADKWRINAGTQIRYYFQPFFEERTFDGTIIISDGTTFDLLGNLGVTYLMNDYLSVKIKYDRSFYPLRYIISNNFKSVVRYHSLGLSISYSF